jgi:predicted double-glycine peptidase
MPIILAHLRSFLCAAMLCMAGHAQADKPEQAAKAESAWLSTYSARGTVPIKSWKTLRDERVVKQALDNSCGAASLATLLNGFYGQNLTEKDLLQAMNLGNSQASFEQMARALPQLGFRAQGYAANWEQLLRLKIPVILYVKHRKDDHFTVLRGISEDTVWLADPSVGNSTYSREQFLAMWETRADSADGLAGKFLAVLPAQAQTPALDDFFTRMPERQSAPAVANLASQLRRP